MAFQTELVVPTDHRFLSRPVASPELLQIVGVDPKWADYIRVLDVDDNLHLLHYLNTLVSLENQVLNEELMKEIGHVRGTVVDLEAGKVVCQSFPFTPELVVEDSYRFHELVPKVTGHAFSAVEGTIVRVFFHGGEWKLCTHRKLDASSSFWSGPTFGTMFNSTRKFEYTSLNKDWCYIMLLSHPANRLIYKIPEAQLMMVAVWDRASGSFLDMSEWKLPNGVVKPTELNLKSHQDLTQSVNSMNSFDRAGVILVSDMKNPQPVKIINTPYFCLRMARGNEPSMRNRYLQLRGTPHLGVLVNWYSDAEYQNKFEEAEHEVEALVKRLHSMYIHRYIKKNFETLPKEEFVVLQRCHTWHNEDRVKNIVTAQKMREIVNDTPNVYLLKMLKRAGELRL